MKRAIGPLKNVLRKYGAFPGPSGQTAVRTACRPRHIFSSKHGGGRTAILGLSSARFLSSTPVLSPADMRSPLPDIDIPVMSFAEFIFRRCDQFKDKEAVYDRLTGRRYSYQQLKRSAIRVASALHRQGYRKGDTISPFTTNLPEFTVLTLAAACLGLVIAPVNPSYTVAELCNILADSGAIAVFTIPQLMPIVQEAIRDPNLPQTIKAVYTFVHAEPGAQFFNDLMEDDGKAFPENVDIDPVRDIMVLPYSSGTTGLPKGVMLSHYNLVANLLQIRQLLPITPEDTTLGILPFFHIYGLLIVQFSTLYDGARMVTLPRFEPEAFLSTLQDEKVSLLYVVPPMAVFLAKQAVVDRYDLSAVTRLICGAAPLGRSVTEECQRRVGAPLYQGYGMTEMLVTNADGHPGHMGTVGRLLPNTRAKIVNPETGEPVAVGETGEFCMKGPQRMLGYHRNQAATDAMMDADGWLHTGERLLPEGTHNKERNKS